MPYDQTLNENAFNDSWWKNIFNYDLINVLYFSLHDHEFLCKHDLPLCNYNWFMIVIFFYFNFNDCTHELLFYHKIDNFFVIMNLIAKINVILIVNSILIVNMIVIATANLIVIVIVNLNVN